MDLLSFAFGIFFVLFLEALFIVMMLMKSISKNVESERNKNESTDNENNSNK